MSLEQQISKGIMEAMKAKDTVRLGALRNAKKYIIEAKTAGPEITELPDADVLKIISKLAKQGTDSAAIFTEQNRPDLAAEELAQVAVFQEFLPKLLGGFRCRGGARIHFAGNAPVIAVRVGSGKSRMKTYMKFDTGSGALFDCRYDECRAMIEKGILQEVRRTEGHSGNLGWTNRSVVGEAVRGVIPEFVLAGNTLAGMPLEVTHGGHSKLGCGVFRWGTVVIDYPGRRFWLLPHAEQPGPPDVSVSGVTVALDGGRLVVGQVWDETLADRVAPGDRIVFLGTVDVSRVDPCAVIRGEIRGDKPQMTVERKDGTRVTVPVKRMK